MKLQSTRFEVLSSRVLSCTLGRKPYRWVWLTGEWNRNGVDRLERNVSCCVCSRWRSVGRRSDVSVLQQWRYENSPGRLCRLDGQGEWVGDWHTVNILKVTHKGQRVSRRYGLLATITLTTCLFNCLSISIIVTVSPYSNYTLLSPLGASDMLFYADLSYTDQQHYYKVVMLYHHSHAVNNSFILSLLDYRLSRLFANFS